MATVLQTPGVSYERVDVGAPGVSPVRTDIAGFVGIATRGPLHTPVLIQSWRQFQAIFGEFTVAGYLAYAVRAFFENGGKRCWIVRVASEAAASASLVLPSKSKLPIWRVIATSPGVWGNDLDVAVRETHAAQTLTDPLRSTPEASVVVSIAGFERGTHVRLSQPGIPFPKHMVISDVDPVGRRLVWQHPKLELRLKYGADFTGFDPNVPILVESVEYTIVVHRLGRFVRAYERLSLIPENIRYGVTALLPLRLPGSEGSNDEPHPPEPIFLEELRQTDPVSIEPIEFGRGDAPLTLGADGLSLLTAADFIGDSFAPTDGERRGLRGLEFVDEVAVLAVPDINIQPVPPPRFAPPPPCVPNPCLPPPPALAVPRAPAVGDLPPQFSEADVFRVQAEMIAQCERRRDRIAILDPPFDAAGDARLGTSAVRAWRTRFESSYAALYFPWLLVLDPVQPDAGVRPIPPSGHVAGQIARTDLAIGTHKAPANERLVWVQDTTVPVDESTHGALNPEGINAIRPFAGRGIRIFGARTVSSDSDFRFLNVRRLLLMIEKALLVATQWAVFEPNDHLTRAKLTLSIWSFLLEIWQSGGLAGSSADEAFFVKCDDATNPPAVRDVGELVAVVGVAPTVPFEFVVVRVGRTNNEFEITEAAASASGGH